MKIRILPVLYFVIIGMVGAVFGGWPEPPWRDLPKLVYIHDSADTIWFYSRLDTGGFPPRYVVTWSKSNSELIFHPINETGIPKDAPLEREQPQKLSSFIQIEPEETQIRGVNIPVPEMTSADLEKMSEWSITMRFNRHMEPSEFGVSNAFSGSLIEIEGLYYFGLQGGMFEGDNHMGGLVIYSPLEKKIEVLRSKYLVACSVLGIKQIDNELALSTADRSLGGVFQTGSGYWEEGAQHRTGLVLYNLDTKKWRNIPFSMPQTFIREMDIIDGQVWMTTNLGISRYDSESDEMRSWNWDLNLTEQP